MGNPVEHSKSPWIHARFAALTGEPVEYGKRLIPLDGFAAAVRAFRAEGGRGCNVTVPFKFEAAALVSRAQRRARHWPTPATSCASTARPSSATTPTASAWCATCSAMRACSWPARDVLLLGAGGAAAGVLGPLLEARPRARGGRQPHAGQGAGAGGAPRDAGRGATSVRACRPCRCDRGARRLRRRPQRHREQPGRRGVPVPRLGAEARRAGLRPDVRAGRAPASCAGRASTAPSARDGLGMLVEQAAEAFLVWRGVRPPSAQVLAELRAELASVKARAALVRRWCCWPSLALQLFFVRAHRR